MHMNRAVVARERHEFWVINKKSCAICEDKLKWFKRNSGIKFANFVDVHWWNDTRAGPEVQRSYLRRLAIFRWRLGFELIELFADKRQILYVEERDVQHVTNNQYGAASLNHLEHAHVHRFAPDRFNERQHDVASIKHRNGQQIQNREVHVENHAEP